jgi:hypothetical protein
MAKKVRKFIVIEISDNKDYLPGLADWKEVLFNAGIGAPEYDSREGWVEWPNQKGMCYNVKSIRVSDERPDMKDYEKVV